MGATEVRVLKGVNLDVKKGEFVAIIGASGSGKSTLLHILGALDKPTKGVVTFEKRDLSRFRAGELNRFRNRMVGFVFQFYHLLDELSVLENVFLPAMTGRSIAGWLVCRRQAKSRAKELLAQLGLAERAKHKPYQLSGGERQRVAIGRGLMNEPKLLLADEPTGNLDSATGNGILDVLERLNKAGQTIVMVTHDDRIAQRAGRIVTLVDGKIEHKNKPVVDLAEHNELETAEHVSSSDSDEDDQKIHEGRKKKCWGNIGWGVFTGIFVLSAIGNVYTSLQAHGNLLGGLGFMIPALIMLLRFVKPLPTIGKGIALIIGCFLSAAPVLRIIYTGSLDGIDITIAIISFVLIIFGYK